MSLLERFLSARKGPPSSEQQPSKELLADLVDAQRYAEALRLIDGAIASHPDDPEWLFLRGSLLFNWGRSWEARGFLLSAWQAGVHKPGLDLHLAWIEMRAGHLDEAQRWVRSALDQDGNSWQAQFALAAILRARGQLGEAELCYENALRLTPGNLDCLLNLVACALSAKAFDRAEAYAHECITQHPDSDMARAALAAALISQERFDAARDVFEHFRNPKSLPPDAGIPLRDGGRVAEAVAFYRRLLAESADLHAHVHYAFSLLKAGQLTEGFEQNEFRWMIDPLRSTGARPIGPLWDGQDLIEKTIHLTTEQGVGDVIQFIRFAPLVKKLGARVIVSLRKPMREIVDGMEGVDAVYQAGDPVPSADFEISVMSLPRVLRTTIDTVPAQVPYIPLKPDRVARWRQQLSGEARFKVGLVWSGDPIGLRNPYKSIPLHMLAQLGDIPGVRFYSLQKGAAAGDAVSVRGEMDLVDLSPRIIDFADTAAIIDSLDLVISICTSVAHLAGALGKPTWTLLSDPADWRWLEHRLDTPWYPTMRLFRQATPGDWISVAEAVRRALAEVAGDRTRLDISPSATYAPTPVSVSADTSLQEVCRAVTTRSGIFQVRPDGNRRVRSLLWYGDYMRSQLQVLAASIEPGSVVVNVASGFGAHIPLLASTVGETGHVFLLESRTLQLPLLANNLAANFVRSVTTITTRIRGAPMEGDDTMVQRVASSSVALDDLGLPSFRWLTIDEEAMAIEVLEGAASSLWNHRPGIFVTTVREGDIDSIEERVRDFGYHFVRIDSPLFDEHNFNRRKDDIFDGEWIQGLLALPEESRLPLPKVSSVRQ